MKSVFGGRHRETDFFPISLYIFYRKRQWRTRGEAGVLRGGGGGLGNSPEALIRQKNLSLKFKNRRNRLNRKKNLTGNNENHIGNDCGHV